MIKAVDFDSFSNLSLKDFEPLDIISVRINVSDPASEIAKLSVSSNGESLSHAETYYSPTEFATITMKQSLTLYVKRKIISMYPQSYSKDDPRVNSYVSRLSYEGIKYVANNIEEFAKQFHSGRITMKIPTNRFHESRKRR